MHQAGFLFEETAEELFHATFKRLLHLNPVGMELVCLCCSLVSPCYSPGMFLCVCVCWGGGWFPLCTMRNQDSRWWRRRRRAISGSCSYLFCVNPQAGGEGGFLSDLVGGHILNTERQREGRGLKGGGEGEKEEACGWFYWGCSSALLFRYNRVSNRTCFFLPPSCLCGRVPLHL